MTRITLSPGILILLLSGSGLICYPGAIAMVSAAPDLSEAPMPYLRPASDCPEDLPLVTAGLLRDLPSYANRILARHWNLDNLDDGFSTVIIAGQPDLTPLEPIAFSVPLPQAIADDTVHQVFFTTWERQYTATDYVDLENYHWLFLSQAEDGWRMTLLFSRLATAAGGRPPTPPRESSQGIVGQAVRLWLRDCRAGAVDPIVPIPPAVPIPDPANPDSSMIR